MLSNKLTRPLECLPRLRHYVPKEELKSIYYAIFSSHWYMTAKPGVRGGSCVENIIKLQNRAI